MAVVYRSQVNTATRGGFAALVIAAHAVLIYAIAVSLSVVEPPSIIKDLNLVYIATPKPVEQPPEVKPPKLQAESELPIPAPVEAPRSKPRRSSNRSRCRRPRQSPSRHCRSSRRRWQ